MEGPREKVICLLWRARGSFLSTKGLRDSGTHTMCSTYELGTTGHTNDCFLVHGEIRVEYIHLQTNASDSPNASLRLLPCVFSHYLALGSGVPSCSSNKVPLSELRKM